MVIRLKSAKLSREEPDAGNLHVRVCGGRGWQHPRLPGVSVARAFVIWTAPDPRVTHHCGHHCGLRVESSAFTPPRIPGHANPPYRTPTRAAWHVTRLNEMIRLSFFVLWFFAVALPSYAGDGAVTARHGMVVAQEARAAKIGA